jgi:hypothetical protein
MRVPKREQKADVGQTFVIAKMTGKHFTQGIPAHFAETIARNLNYAGLHDYFRVDIKDFSARNIGRGQIRVTGDGQVPNALDIAVEPDIPSSNQNRFNCALYCTENYPREEVKRRLTTETNEESVEIEPMPEEEIIVSQPKKIIYPNLNEPQFSGELYEIIRKMAEYGEETPASNLNQIVAEVCHLGNCQPRTIGTQVIRKITCDKDNEHAILTTVRRPSKSIRGYALGQLGRSLVGLPAESLVETPAPVAAPFVLAVYVAELKQIVAAGIKAEAELAHYRQIVEEGQKAQTIMDEIRQLLAKD